MAALTIDEAITKVRQRLDDTSTTNPRWTDAQVKDALTDAISRCVTKYSDEGGDRFDLESTAFSTSASTGQVDISSIAAAWVKAVGVVVGNTTYMLPRQSGLRRGYPDLSARSLRILYVREYEISGTSSHPLIGVGATAANTWRAFDRWVCLEAAVMLTPKDMEMNRIGVLRTERDEAEKSALARPSTPGGYPVPRKEWNPLDPWRLRWQFLPSSSTISLTAEW